MKKWKNANGWKIIFRDDAILVYRPFRPIHWIIVVIGVVIEIALWQFMGVNESLFWVYLFLVAFVVFSLLPSPFIPFTLIRKWELKASPSGFGFQPIESVSLNLEGCDITLLNGDTSVLVWKGGNDDEMAREIYDSLSQFLSKKLTQHSPD